MARRYSNSARLWPQLRSRARVLPLGGAGWEQPGGGRARQTAGRCEPQTFTFTHFRLASNIAAVENPNTQISKKVKKIQHRESGGPEFVLRFPCEWVRGLTSQCPFPYPINGEITVSAHCPGWREQQQSTAGTARSASLPRPCGRVDTPTSGHTSQSFGTGWQKASAKRQQPPKLHCDRDSFRCPPATQTTPSSRVPSGSQPQVCVLQFRVTPSPPQ